MRYPAQTVVGFGVLVMTALASPLASAQSTRKATDLAALAEYPAFYQGEPVVVRAELIEDGGEWLLLHPNESRPLHVIVEPDGPSLSPGRVEARGTFWDLGRLEPNDARVRRNNLQRALAGPTGDGSISADDWPRPGTYLVLSVTDAFPVTVEAIPSLRDVVLDAPQYIDAPVTVLGQFRGRNLFGDVAQAPGLSRWDFVIRAADAALWVAGTRPRGQGFDLDTGARSDTGRWLQVSGTLRHGNGLVWLERPTLTLASAPAAAPEPEATAPRVGPSPSVIFSVPTDEDFGVALDTRVRLQFSRDMDPESFDGQVRVVYQTWPGGITADTPNVPPFETAYDAASRSLTIAFAEPFPADARFQTVAVELSPTIVARDGAPLETWALSFVLGGE